MEKSLVIYGSKHLVPAISAPQALEQWVQRSAIPAAEADANQTALHRVQKEDQRRHAAATKSALAEYKKQYSLLSRIMLYFQRGLNCYQPNLAPLTTSPETQLLEQVVALQEAAIKGHELFKALPDVVRKMKLDYEKLAVRQGELEAKIVSMEGELCALPERQREYAALLRNLETYDTLSTQEKITLSTELQAQAGVDVLPPLENAAVRSLALRKLRPEQQRLTSGNLSSLLEVLTFEYTSVQRQQRIIESQERQLEQGWKPALVQLSRLKEQYDMLNRFTSGARLLIGMNELRRDTAEIIARSEEVMGHAAAHIDSTQIEAEAFEESFAPPAKVRILPEADADEAIIDVEEETDAEEEPFLMEQK